MITLLTGAPGAGKTALAVSMIDEAVKKGRRVYVFGLDGLVLPHDELVDPKTWPEEGVVEDGSLIVIDEVQDVWRPARAGMTLPKHITELEVHRHRGLDFILTTQQPGLLHSNVRALVGRHIHLRDFGVLGRRWYEWTECSAALSTSKALINKSYKLPKRSFKDYTSATIHVKPARGVPKQLVVMAVVVPAVLVLGWVAYGRIKAKSHPDALPAQAAASSPERRLGHQSQAQTGQPDPTRVAPPWPVYQASVPPVLREPLDGRGVQLEGVWIVGAVRHAQFGLVVQGERIATLTLRDMVSMGYAFVELGPCVASLRFGPLERVVTCPRLAPQPPAGGVRPIDSPASAPAAV